MNHEKLIVYQKALDFVGHAESIRIPWSAWHSVRDQWARAAESIAMNIAEASAMKDLKLRMRYTDYALGSALECAACVDIAKIKGLIQTDTSGALKLFIAEIARILIGLRKSWEYPNRNQIRESNDIWASSPAASQTQFSHEQLDVYQVALQFMEWWHILYSASARQRKSWKELDTLATSMVLNIAEGNGRFAALDHRRFLKISEIAAVKCAVHLDLLQKRNPAVDDQLIDQGKLVLNRISKMLTGLQARMVTYLS